MSFGVSVINNDAGEAVLDQENFPMRIISEGTVNKNGSDYSIPIPSGLSVDPIIYIGWPISTAMFVNKGFNNNVATIGTDTGPASLSYWVCAFAPPAPSSSDYGLEIYNEAGSVIFSSKSKYMRMRGIIDAYTSNGTTSGPGPFNHASLPNLYPVAVPMARVTGQIPPQQFPPFGAWVIGGGRRVSTTQFAFNQFAAVPLNQIPSLPYPLGGSEAILLGSIL